jgi:TRAP-type C4-dicarboxylate transport system substrate-binding protein
MRSRLVRRNGLARGAALASAVLAGALLAAAPAQTMELVYGSWLPARTYINAEALPRAFDGIKTDTKGAVTWRLIPGGQIADGKATFTAIRDGLMQGGLGVASYVPNTAPSVTALYGMLLFGDDLVAANGAAVETVTLHCPSCLDEYREINAAALGGFVAGPYKLLCRVPIRTVDDLKGKRVRATGGQGELLRMAGAVPVAGTLTEAVTLLQRGGIECVLGATEWLRTLGYADVAKWVSDYPLGMLGPAIGMLINRDAWNTLSTEHRTSHMRHAARLTADMAIENFIINNEEALAAAMKESGVRIVETEKHGFDRLVADYRAIQMDRNIGVARSFGVADPAAPLAAYERAFEKWKALSRGIGRDVDKFSQAIWTEVYSKVDPAKF